jgi:hypothetical protein
VRELLRDPRDEKGWARKVYDHPLINALSLGRAKPSYIPPRTFALAVLDLIAPADPSQPRLPADVTKAIAALPPELKNTVTVLFDEAGHDVEKLKAGLEIWFNSAMERVSGWYKRRSQNLLLVLAAIVTILFNADTITIVHALSHDPALRASLLAQAQAAAREPRPSPADAGADARLESAIQRINQTGLPVGWRNAAWGGGGLGESLLLWVTRLCGWGITMFAVSLGAPFWFDLLNKFMNIRAAGKAPEEAQKDPKKVPKPAEAGDTAT